LGGLALGDLALGGSALEGCPVQGMTLGDTALQLIASEQRTLPVVTKAGGFGDPDTLLVCRKALKMTEPWLP
jgi:uncharacterized protein YgbK (DUF1537 family)